MKRIAFCFDGTWNRLDAPYPTNVVMLAESILPHASDGATQIIHYDQGVGTGAHDRWGGGLFGAGLLTHLANAYRFLIFNYEPGDELYVFGFSRGAYTARAFVGFIHNCSIIERRHAGKISEALALYQMRRSQQDERSKKFQAFRAAFAPDICVDQDEDRWRCANVKGYTAGQAPVLRIRYVGVWDTVGSLGVPDSMLIAPFVNAKYKFYDLSLTDMVVQARHAVAIDERRKSFAATLWDNLPALNAKLGYTGAEPDAPYQQQWFPGVHGGVGGGGDIRGLSDAALDWIATGARQAGLDFDTSAGSTLYSLEPNFLAPLDNVSQKKGFSLVSFAMAHLPAADRSPGPTEIRDVSLTARSRWHAKPGDLSDKKPYRPKPLAEVADQLDASPARPDVAVAPAAMPTVTGRHEGPVPAYYTVIRGDSLRAIALRFYGGPEAAEAIFKANNMLTDPNRIYVGQVLQLPQP